MVKNDGQKVPKIDPSYQVTGASAPEGSKKGGPKIDIKGPKMTHFGVIFGHLFVTKKGLFFDQNLLFNSRLFLTPKDDTFLIPQKSVKKR